MFGFRYLKATPTQYVIEYRNGQKRRSGAGLAFFYYQPFTSLTVIPIGSTDISFIFNEITSDFQPITVQGQITYRINQPERVAGLLNYSVGNTLEEYISDDPDKLSQRIVNLVQLLTRTEVEGLELRNVLRSSNTVARAVSTSLTTNPELQALGVEVLAFVILAIKPTPDVARALEAQTRENLLKQADDAVYERRNSAVDQERRIKENELNTEMAVAEKQRQIQVADMEGKIRLENERKELVTAQNENSRAKADTEAYAIAASLQPLSQLPPEVLQLLGMQSAEPRLMIATALRDLADNAEKIGQLNITPDLLESLLKNR